MYTSEQIIILKGEFRIKCIKVGGYTMQGYGNYIWVENEEQNLLDELLPSTLRAGDYNTACNMCKDPARELAQRIVAGDFIIISEKKPDPSILFQEVDG